MKRTINERKAWRWIFICIPVFIFSLGFFGAAASTGNIIAGASSICAVLGSAIGLFFNAYGLGWEYKRLSLQDDAFVSNPESEKKE